MTRRSGVFITDPCQSPGGAGSTAGGARPWGSLPPPRRWMWGLLGPRLCLLQLARWTLFPGNLTPPQGSRLGIFASVWFRSPDSHQGPIGQACFHPSQQLTLSVSRQGCLPVSPFPLAVTRTTQLLQAETCKSSSASSFLPPPDPMPEPSPTDSTSRTRPLLSQSPRPAPSPGHRGVSPGFSQQSSLFHHHLQPE